MFESYIDLIADKLISSIFLDCAGYETVVQILDVILFEKNIRVLFLITVEVIVSMKEEFIKTINDFILEG